jgi:4-amino-4-deoxy-L-arabinose transferase-like glycosyltransferase
MGLSSRSFNRQRVVLVSSAFLACVWLALNLSALTSYPVPQTDDGWIGSTAVNFMRTGRFGLPVFGDIYGSSQNYVHLGRLFSIALAASFWIFGVGLLQGRLVALLGALVSAGLVFLLAKRLSGVAAGAGAAVLYLLAWRTFYASHMVRPETWVQAGGLCCFALFLRVRGARSSREALALGLLSSLIVDIYFTAIYYSLVVGLGVVWTFRSRSDWRLIGAFAAGGTLGLVYWLTVHLLPDPAQAILQWKVLSVSVFHADFGDSNLLAPLFKIPVLVQTGILGYTRLGFMEFGYIIAGILALAYKSSRADRYLLAAGLVFTLAYVYIGPEKGLYHLTLFIPIFCLLFAQAASKAAEILARQRPGWTAPAAIALLMAPLALVYITGDIVLAWQNRAIDYGRYAAQLRQYVPAGSSIVGEGTWYFAFHNDTYTFDDYILMYNLGRAPAESPAAAVMSVIVNRHINVILLDERLGSWYQDAESADMKDLWLSLRQYATGKCQLKGTVEDYFYGVDQAGPALKRTNVFVCP